MCGIVGQVSRRTAVDHAAFNVMRDALIHRGPDGCGSWFDPRRGVALGHRRLSIVDLSETGRQPMTNEDGSIHITYNGEVYNHDVLRRELRRNHQFAGTSDTEVILHGYEEWGVQGLLAHLNGMFAFAIYDAQRNVIVCARDRLGVKPLVYYADDHHFFFASEIKALLRSPLVPARLDDEALYEYLLYRYVPAPRTIYAGIRKLEPGWWLEFDVEQFTIGLNRFWDPRAFWQTRAGTDMVEPTIVAETGARIEQAVAMQLRADVPVDSLLSSGLDSSLLAAISAQRKPDVRAFSLRIASPVHDELEGAAGLARSLSIAHHHRTLDPFALGQVADRVIRHFDEPLGDTAIIPTYVLSELASRETKVAISGDGGDELFHGYHWYQRYADALDGAVSRYPGAASHELYRGLISTTFDSCTAEALLAGRVSSVDYPGGDLFRRRLGKSELAVADLGLLDTLTFLADDNLQRVDMASMAHSLEVRVPYLDHELVEYVFSLPFTMVYQNRTLKYLLREVARDRLPAEVVTRRKRGFSTPTLSWLGRDYRQEILSGRAVSEGVLERKAVEAVLNTETAEERLWLLYLFERWYSQTGMAQAS